MKPEGKRNVAVSKNVLLPSAKGDTLDEETLKETATSAVSEHSWIRSRRRGDLKRSRGAVGMTLDDAPLGVTKIRRRFSQGGLGREMRALAAM